MLTILISCIFLWLFFKAFRMAWKMAWGILKIGALVLCGLALLLFIFFLLGGSLVPLIAPLLALALLFLLLKAFLEV